ncbi:NAD-P-binding protein [Vararia minispora EC-137]|uniref:NAD-P-binding protein n=1 Tax=Vararia minispora EC-137 TaxID=1314806 RepID=A0ACB8QR25_9AGAM|nr:NAD-P-binding protein [Vararia minispora EC-137]
MYSTPVVVVTGASRGLGLAIASILLASADAAVVAISRSRTPELNKLASVHGHALRIVQCSATDAPTFTQAITSAAQDFGRLDALVLNHGVLEPISRLENPVNNAASWASHFDSNVFSFVTAIQASLPSLRKSPIGGRVIFVSSGAAVGAVCGWGAYNASKAAVNSICRTLASEENNITSVAIRPGKIDTAMQGDIRAGGSEHMDRPIYDSFVREHTEGKLLPPDVPGHVIAKLALYAPAELSGKFLSWDSEECRPFSKPA